MRYALNPVPCAPILVSRRGRVMNINNWEADRMYVYACVCVRPGERERDCFHNKIYFSFARNRLGRFGSEGPRVVDFSYLFLQNILSSLSDFSLSLVWSCCLVSVYPNPSGIVKNVYPFDFLTVFVLSGSVYAFARLPSCLFDLLYGCCPSKANCGPSSL